MHRKQGLLHKAAYFVLLHVARFLLSLRYRVTIRGLDKVQSSIQKGGVGTVFLPNHPAEIDPVILIVYLGLHFSVIRPLVVEHFYKLKGFHWVMKLVSALSIPTMDEKASVWRGKLIAKKKQEIAQGLTEGENFLIYPSGRLKVDGREVVGGSSFVHQIIEEVPQLQVVLVRTTGLWGSRFSRAITGYSPDFGKELISSLWTLVKNGIFFTPRRKVLVELSTPSEDFPWKEERIALNKYLEDWYNRYPNPGPEPVSRVSLAFWKEQYVEPKKMASSEEEKRRKNIDIPLPVQKRVQEQLSDLCGKAPERIEPSMDLAIDLGMDSLDVAQVYIFLDRQFDRTDVALGSIRRVEDVCLAAVGEYERATSKEEKTFAWPKELRRRAPFLPQGNTIPEAFLSAAEKMDGFVCAADRFSGVLTYRKMKRAALLLADKFRAFPEQNVGVLLPSTVGAYLVILSLMLAKKVPVMLNWTTGTRALNFAEESTSLQRVITSMSFLDKLDHVELGEIENRFLFLEELKEDVSLMDKILCLVRSVKSARSLTSFFKLDTVSSDAPAVLLFTSGTESLPKAVPLSHRNILVNQRAAMECVALHADDCLYGILPPFHSFGFSITGLFPLLCGVKTFYAPDPNDSHGLAEDIAAAEITMFCSAPSFLRAVFSIADKKKLSSLRLIVSGAEKAPSELFSYVEKNLPHAKLIEGYGITECSPVVTIVRPGEPAVGVGRPLDGIEVCIIDEQDKILPLRSEGEICIRGESVFSGYLLSNKCPFITLSEQKWYRSGDRGYLDEKGNLTLTGRLKRFVKIGGEMISLGGLEEEIFSVCKDKGWVEDPFAGSSLALIAREEDKASLILFTALALAKDEINIALKERGWGRIVKIAEIKQIKEIPLTGTGKIDYRYLEEHLV